MLGSQVHPHTRGSSPRPAMLCTPLPWCCSTLGLPASRDAGLMLRTGYRFRSKQASGGEDPPKVLYLRVRDLRRPSRAVYDALMKRYGRLWLPQRHASVNPSAGRRTSSSAQHLCVLFHDIRSWDSAGSAGP